MNLEVFNRVNWKETYHSSGRHKNQSSISGMYSKWTSLTHKLYSRTCYEHLENNSVLSKFSSNASKQVTVLIVKQLASSLGITHAAEPSNLTSEKEISWCMEIICYGLMLPLTEHDTVRDCVNVYCEWLSALHPVPRISVPIPVCKDANFFARRIIAHFLNLFMPRNGEGSDIINKQAVLCHRVLRTLQNVTQISKNIESDTWQTLLLFLLTINDTLLAPPTIKDDVGDQLCERVLSVLLEIWLTACLKCYPSPPLWKTLQEMAINWRHRTALIEQWNRINLTLTSKVLEIMYGVTFPQLKIGGDEDLQTTINNMSEECVMQTWFRILHTIGNPIDLCHSNIISQTPQFLQYAITNDNPSEHPCLSVLPLNFYKAIKGVAALVDAFLGSPVFIQWEEYSSYPGYQQAFIQSSLPGINTSSAVELCSPTPPSRRRIAKSFSVSSSKSMPKGASGSSNKGGSVSSSSSVASSQNVLFQGASSLNYISLLSSNNRNVLLSPLRPKCNSILHLFGDWLFEASYNSECTPAMAPGGKGNINWTTGETGSMSSGSISSFLLRKGSSSQPNSLTADSSDPDTGNSTPLATSLMVVSSVISDKFVCGRAEAVGTLCRIFCSKKTGEEILPIYLSRFYMIIQQSLLVKECGECDEVMASVLLNSVGIFSLDLDGVLLLIPYFIEALEMVLPERNLRFNDNVALMSAANIGTGGSSSNNTPAAPSMANVSSSGTIVNVATVSTSTAMVNASSVAVPPISTTSVVGSSVAGTTFANVASTLSIGNSDMISDIGSTFNYNMSTHYCGDIETGVAMAVSNVSIASSATSNNSSASTVTTSTAVALVELRKACTHLLLSMLPLPLHFQNLPMKEFGHLAYRLNLSGACVVTFGQVRSRLVNLLINALQIETDSLNTHLLLGGLLFIVQDSALCEQDMNVGNLSHINNLNDLPSNIPIISDSAHSLFVRSMYLVCHRLISSWKADLNVSLAAIEFLSGLARIYIREMDILECKRAVKWLCDFIMHQCWRPPQAHSKDLHSSIVAAFQCAVQWLISHPALLKEKECLNTLLEVVELGISGSKSQGKFSEPVRMKDEKELKPVSMRVRDAAEALLTIIMEQITDTEINSSSLCLLDEIILLKQFGSTKLIDPPLTYEHAVSKFHYFLFENNTMIALLQEPLEDPQPTITVLIRNCFGRHSWTLHLRHLPRHRSATKQNYCNLQAMSAGRPVSMSETSFVPTVHQRYFPDYVNKIDTYTTDKSIQSLENISDSVEDSELEELIEQHHQFENENNNVEGDWFTERNPPSACDDFHTARMFLCHLGLLSKYKNSDKQNENCSLIALNNNKEGFAQELRILDKISTKTYDTCHVFYVKTGQKRPLDILENTMIKSGISRHFIELLYSLGWPVKINRHTGWTGHISTSSKISYNKKMSHSESLNPNRENNEENGCYFYDGIERIIYWSDVISEVAFVVPSPRLHSSTQHSTGNWHDRSISINNDSISSDVTISNNNNNNSTDKIRTMSLDANSTDSKSGSVFNKKRTHLVTTVMLVWLESFEDHSVFPINELLPYTNTGVEANNKVDVRDCYVIFIHAMQNGLLKIKLQGPVNRIYIATPLVDGMVTSRRSAGQLVRQTVLNICRRRRLDSDSYQLPHVRRRLKLQEMKDKYECKMDIPELLTYLLKNC